MLVKQTHRQDFDVLIVGGGLVGSACALALRQQNLAVGLVESRAPQLLAPDAGFDTRIYAISPGSANLLDRLGVWNKLDPERICPIENMQVRGGAADASLDLRAYEAHVSSLGFIVENRALQQGLWQALPVNDVTVLSNHDCLSATWSSDKAELVLGDGNVLRAGLLIAADGANSWLRAQAGIAVNSHDYEQMAVVANFETALPHAQTARQWFSREGVLAWLPLPGQHVSMVWSTSSAHAQHLLALSKTALAKTVAAAGHHELGELRCLNQAQAFPLRMQTVQNLARPGLVLIGDAAHTIHPLAGQGVNLGFRDISTLARILAIRPPQQGVGDFMLLRRYERARKADMMAMRFLTDGLYRLFASDQPLVRRLRNWGLAFTDRQDFLKQRLVKQALL